MRVVEHADAQAFLSRALPFLEEHEAEHGLPIGLARAMSKRPPAPGEGRLFATVQRSETGGALLAALVREEARKAILSKATEGAARLLGEWAAKKRVLLPGAAGPVGVVRAFAEAYAPALGLATRKGLALRTHVLREVTDPPAPPGRARPAEARDRATLLPWLADFVRHTTDRPAPDEVARSLDRMISGGRLLVWEDATGALVCMAAESRGTPRGASISCVYTPEPLRRRGHASALVAALTRRILSSGKEFVTLFTDLANPTSNAMYARIGYVAVADWEEALFEGAGAREAAAPPDPE